jgi:ubiquinone/menaquinone biosynthesis C-methylase UbiE
MNKSDNVKSFFDNSEVYLSTRPVIRLRGEIVRDLLCDQDGKELLDIGCGDGSVSMSYITTNNICFLDFSTSMISEVSRRIPSEFKDHATLIQANFEDYEFSKRFDVILCIGVLAHVKDLTNTIAKASSLLTTGGKILFQLSDVNHFFYRVWHRSRSNAGSYGYELNRTTPEKIKSIAHDNQLQLRKVSCYPVIYPLVDRFGHKAVYSFLKTVYKSSLLSFLSSEYVMLFEKVER